MTLPPPLIVRASASRQYAHIVVSDGAGNDPKRSGAFGTVLAQARADRGLTVDRLEIFAPHQVLDPPPTLLRDEIWVPHVFCWQNGDTPALAWERSTAARASRALEATPEQIERWSAHRERLIALLHMAARDGGGDGHLSMRWILGHEHEAASALTADQIGIEHVSLHVGSDEEEQVVLAFTEGLGMIEITRPAAIAVPGRWLVAGASRVHLNSRSAGDGEAGFPGTAPNHICFAVADVDGGERALRAAGLQTERAGSLGSQVWTRLRSGTVIELQPLPRPACG